MYIDTDNLIFGTYTKHIERNGIRYFMSSNPMYISLKQSSEEVKGWTNVTGQAITIYTQDNKSGFVGCTKLSYDEGYTTILISQNTFRVWGHEQIEE